MRGFAAAAALTLVLSVAPIFAQAPAAGQPATPQGQGQPQAPAPRPAPAAPGQPTPAAPAAAPMPLPDGAKYAFINIQRIASESSEGKAATARVNALVQKKQTEGNEKTKQLQSAQQKLDSGGNVMSDNARAQLQKEIDRLTLDIQRFNEDAQQEVQTLQNELQNEFQTKLLPIVQQVAREKSLLAVFSAADSGIVWGEPGLDITAEVIKKFDAGGAAPASSGAVAQPRPTPPATSVTPATPAAPRPSGTNAPR